MIMIQIDELDLIVTTFQMNYIKRELIRLNEKTLDHTFQR